MAQELYNLLDEIAATQAEIHLMNIYKGVPLSFPAKVIGGSGRSLRVLADRYQMVCMYIEKESFIQSKLLPQIMRAKVIELDPAERAAVLTDFEPASSGIGTRMHVRVQPEGPLEGSIQNSPDGRTLKAELADISQDGLGIYLAAENFSPEEIFHEARVSITLTLPGVYETAPRKTRPLAVERPVERFDRENVRFTPFSSPMKGRPVPGESARSEQLQHGPEVVVQGTVANIRQEADPYRYRVGVHILPADPSRALIGQLIVHRQAEIIREIKTLYDLLLQDVEQ